MDTTMPQQSGNPLPAATSACAQRLQLHVSWVGSAP